MQDVALAPVQTIHLKVEIQFGRCAMKGAVQVQKKMEDHSVDRLPQAMTQTIQEI
tara:strand:- start:172 stop:336 length:165 start_codon:yes stop_codon:yes gene_type:complete